MPSVYPPGTRKGNKHWLVRGHVLGRQYESVAKDARSQREAEAYWQQYADDIRRAESPALPEPLSFAAAARAYRDSGPRSPAQLGFLARIEGAIGSQPCDAIRPGEVMALARRLYPRAKPATWNRNVVSVVAAVLNRFARDGRCHPFRPEKFRQAEVLKRQPTPGAGPALIAATAGHRRLLLAFYHWHGLRPSDALALTWEGLDIEGGWFQVVVPKSGRLKRLPLAPPVADLLAELRRALPEGKRQGRLFPWASRKAVDRWLRPLCAELGVVFSARLARHLFASDHVANGASELDLVELGTWASPNSTRPYVSAREARARQLLARRSAAAAGQEMTAASQTERKRIR